MLTYLEPLLLRSLRMNHATALPAKFTAIAIILMVVATVVYGGTIYAVVVLLLLLLLLLMLLLLMLLLLVRRSIAARLVHTSVLATIVPLGIHIILVHKVALFL